MPRRLRCLGSGLADGTGACGRRDAGGVDGVDRAKRVAGGRVGCIGRGAAGGCWCMGMGRKGWRASCMTGVWLGVRCTKPSIVRCVMVVSRGYFYRA